MHDLWIAMTTERGMTERGTERTWDGVNVGPTTSEWETVCDGD
jgi:hypothetical protein